MYIKAKKRIITRRPSKCQSGSVLIDEKMKSDRRKRTFERQLDFHQFLSFSQYGEDDEDEQSEEGDGSTSPRPFDR